MAELSGIPEDSFEEFIETTKSKEKELTSSGALLLAREIQRQRLIADLEKDPPENTFDTSAQIQCHSDRPAMAVLSKARSSRQAKYNALPHDVQR